MTDILARSSGPADSLTAVPLNVPLASVSLACRWTVLASSG